VLCQLCGCCFSICTRFALRKRLSIKGTIWEDCVLHCLLRPCALCQEMQEITAAGYTGIMYQDCDEPLMPLAPVQPAGGVDTTPLLTGEEPQPEPEPEPKPPPEPEPEPELRNLNRQRDAQETARRPTARPLLPAPVAQAEAGEPARAPAVHVAAPGVEVARVGGGDADGRQLVAVAPPPAGARPVVPWGPGHPSW
jgi:hypothetical protein